MAKKERDRRGRAIPAAVLALLAAVLLWAGAALNDQGAAAPEATATQPAVAAVPAPTASPTPEPTPAPTPFQPGWELRLVNRWNPLSEEEEPPELAQLPNGMKVDARCYDALMDMLDDCRGAGLEPIVSSAFRTWAYQEKLYENQVAYYGKKGYSKEEAPVRAGRVVAVPGTSEHQVGLAVDLCDADYQLLNEDQEDTPVQQWLMEHCWEYGFILRYPNDRSETTGIIYEPWHYRYVGLEAALEMQETGECLEDYLARLGAEIGKK